VKGAATHNQKCNRDESKEIRTDVAFWFLENSSCTFLWVDEFGFNLNTSPSDRISASPSGDYRIDAVDRPFGSDGWSKLISLPPNVTGCIPLGLRFMNGTPSEIRSVSIRPAISMPSQVMVLVIKL
jgi:hypothetical protein